MKDDKVQSALTTDETIYIVEKILSKDITCKKI